MCAGLTLGHSPVKSLTFNGNKRIRRHPGKSNQVALEGEQLGRLLTFPQQHSVQNTGEREGRRGPKDLMCNQDVLHVERPQTKGFKSARNSGNVVPMSRS